MKEISESITIDTSLLEGFSQRVQNIARLFPVVTDLDSGRFSFSGNSAVGEGLVLFTVEVNLSDGKTKCTVSSEVTALNAQLLKLFKKELPK